MQYFLYSDEQIKEKNAVLAQTSKVFEPGTVVVNGRKVKFTQLSTSPTIPRFVDTKIVASGENLKDFSYVVPKNKSKRG